MRTLVRGACFTLAWAAGWTPTAAVPQSEPPHGRKPDYGVLVMAHGGNPAWNLSVHQAVAPIAAARPTVVAFGMADPVTLSAALDTLHAQGVTKVAVVRLFVSGRSFLPETRYLLGLTDSAPSVPAHSNHEGREDGHRGAARPNLHRMEIATGDKGLMDSPITDLILRERGRHAGLQPGLASVLLLAHGMGGEQENQELLSAMDRATALLHADGFHSVYRAALREDWPEARVEVEREVRAYVQAESSAGRTLLLIPYRLSGLGPYREVLEGLPYQATEGILPHPGVTEWITSSAHAIACRAWPGLHECRS